LLGIVSGLASMLFMVDLKVAANPFLTSVDSLGFRGHSSSDPLAPINGTSTIFPIGPPRSKL
jgi:hypothetical protein